MRCKICEVCHKEFVVEGNNQKYCSPECSRKIYKKNYTERNEQYIKPKAKSGAGSRGIRKKRSAKDIVRINTKALEMGLSYGQYVALYGDE